MTTLIPSRSAELAQPLPVLLYHGVGTRDGQRADRFRVSARRFREHLAAIRDRAGTALTIADVAAVLHGEMRCPQRPYAITFDDGYPDTPGAAALLAEHGIASTVFLATGRLRGSSPPLPARAIAELCALGGVELGAHTISHPRLDELAPDHAAREIEGSKRELEHLGGVAVRSFAYPHGAYDARTRDAVIGAGYDAAAAVKNAISHTQDDPFAIARFTITASTTAAQIARVLDGRGAPPAWIGERRRTRAWRRVRRCRRLLLDGVGR